MVRVCVCIYIIGHIQTKASESTRTHAIRYCEFETYKNPGLLWYWEPVYLASGMSQSLPAELSVERTVYDSVGILDLNPPTIFCDGLPHQPNSFLRNLLDLEPPKV